MGKYVYIVDYSSNEVPHMYEGVFSSPKKANDYVNEMIEMHKGEGYRVKEDSPQTLPFDFILRLVILTRKGRNWGTLKYRINKLPIK